MSTETPALAPDTSVGVAQGGIYESDIRPEDGNGSVRFVINPRVFPLELVHQAAFVFIDKYYAFLDRDEAGRVYVSLKGKDKLDATELTRAMGEFANELLAQAVRRLVNKQNGKLREMVVAKALWGTGAVDINRGLAYAEKQEDQQLRARLDDEARREQEELDRLLAEIESEYAPKAEGGASTAPGAAPAGGASVAAADPMNVATPWSDKHGKKPTEVPQGSPALPEAIIARPGAEAPPAAEGGAKAEG